MSAPKTPEDRVASITPFGLRMPATLREDLQRWAVLNKRSLNAEILDRLERTLSGDYPSHDGLSVTQPAPERLKKGIAAMQAMIDDLRLAMRDMQVGADIEE